MSLKIDKGKSIVGGMMNNIAQLPNKVFKLNDI